MNFKTTTAVNTLATGRLSPRMYNVLDWTRSNDPEKRKKTLKKVDGLIERSCSRIDSGIIIAAINTFSRVEGIVAMTFEGPERVHKMNRLN